MIKGELRERLLKNCPDEFYDELKGCIDDMETLLNNIVGLLDIDRLSDLENIETAKDELEDFVDALY